MLLNLTSWCCLWRLLLYHVTVSSLDSLLASHHVYIEQTSPDNYESNGHVARPDTWLAAAGAGIYSSLRCRFLVFCTLMRYVNEMLSQDF